MTDSDDKKDEDKKEPESKPESKPAVTPSRRAKTPPGVPTIPEVPRETSFAREPSPVVSEPSAPAPAAASAPIAPASQPARPIRTQASRAAAPPPTPKAKDPDRQGRFLIVDLYSLSLGGKPNWPALVTASNDRHEYVGAILKATEGAVFDTSWFEQQWPFVKAVGGDRYGVDWFRGAYHYLKFNKTGAEQAEAYLNAIKRAGGWGAGDIYPIVDIELGGPSNTNQRASAQQIVDVTSAWAARVKSATGRKAMAYGRGAMRDKKIGSKMGCDVVWNPSYTAEMHLQGLVSVGNGPGAWRLDDIALWQFSDGREIALPGYPKTVPGFGAVDVSVYIDGARTPTLKSLRARLLGI